MRGLLAAVRGNPVRVYTAFAAVLALAAYYAPELPVPYLLGIGAAVLGVGEAVRSDVTPEHRAQAREEAALYQAVPTPPNDH